MAETARMAVFQGWGKPFEIREYPVPGARAGRGGGRAHAGERVWVGPAHVARRARRQAGLGAALHTGHEMGYARQARRGRHRRLERPAAEGGRPGGFRGTSSRADAVGTAAGASSGVPEAYANGATPCEVWPYFKGGSGDYFYLHPSHAVFRVPDDLSDEPGRRGELRHLPGLRGRDVAGSGAGETVVIQGAGGLGAYATRWRGSAARAGRRRGRRG